MIELLREQLQPQPVTIADGDSRFEQELQDAQNEIKVSEQTKYYPLCTGQRLIPIGYHG